MLPPLAAADQLIGVRDAFDIPVFVRHSSPLQAKRRPMPTRIEKASTPWPSSHDVPPPGEYLVTATWRDIVFAAVTVGRDLAPWFAKMPGLAWSECIARRSPLMAYLRRCPNAKAHPGSSGYLIEPNAVYQYGTERTARGAFGYRVGMTMAEWVCHLMGLGPTLHAETNIPAGAGPAWSAKTGLPDLIGDHWHQPKTWLVEAKGARRAGYTVLAKGALQLTSRGLMSGPHVRTLCGTSLEPRLFVTVDVEFSPSRTSSISPHNIPDPATDDTALVTLAESQMLTYYSLSDLPASARSVRPVGQVVADPVFRQQRTGLVHLLEQDPSTQQERLLAREYATYADIRPFSRRFDMLTGPVPGTDIIIGMSRRLFETCRRLAAEDIRIAEEVGFDIGITDGDEIDEGEEGVRENNVDFAERKAASSSLLRTTAREGFGRGAQSSWRQLLDEEPPIITEPQPDLLESATADVYLAIDRSRTLL
jgi:hypothetical protein